MFKLYWCATEDGEEDWFVLAASPRAAARWFEENEGYDPREATARAVLTVPDDVLVRFANRGRGQLELPCWPDITLIIESGGDVLRIRAPKVVRLRGELFVEGIVDQELQRRLDDTLEAEGRGRPNGTTRETPS
jgi:hypothetical protein